MLIFTGMGELASGRLLQRAGGRVERLAAPMAVAVAVAVAVVLLGLGAVAP